MTATYAVPAPPGRRSWVVAAALALVVATLPVLLGVVPGLPRAHAAVNDQPLSGATSPMWQTNHNVEALAVSGGRVYAGGSFTAVRPPSAAAGRNETPRTYLAAFDAATGALVSGFDVTLNGRVDDIAISPDGTRMYIVGMFTQVNGQARSRVAALNLPSGTLATGFTANANATVMAVDADASTVYVTGDFTSIRSTARARFAALDASTGALRTAFSADLDARGAVVEIAPDGSRVLVGGGFLTVRGVTTGAVASVDPVTGELEQWEANTDQPININCGARVTDIITQGDQAYVTAEGDPPGCYEGTYSARIADGELSWNSTCLGASLGLALMDGVLYKASHQHDCAFNPGDARGGYVGGTARDSFTWWRLVGQNVSDGSFVHWSPNTNAATGANPAGPRVLATDGTQMFVGGDFSHVNNQPQQGIARFGRGNGAAPDNPAAPTVQANAVGSLTVQWPAVRDRDNGTLTYQLFRGNTIIHTVTRESYPWYRPTMRYDDTGLTPGASYSYRLRVTDGTNTSASSSSTTATVRSAPRAPYAEAVRSLGAELYWRLDDSGTTLADSSTGGGNPGEKVGGVSTTAGPLTGNGGVTFDGSTGHLTSQQSRPLSPAFTQSAWFRTTSITGGSLLAVTDAKTGVGTYSDRAVTMDNNGNVVFSVHQPPRTGSPDPLGPRLNNVRQEGRTFNDGRWHQVVATWSGTTAALYVDGMPLGTYEGTAGGLTSGFQRVGYTDLRNEQAVFGRNYYNQKWPLTEHFNGSIDEVAVFPRALSAQEVEDLWGAGVAGGGPAAPDPVAPDAAFTVSSNQLSVAVDGSSSSDSDGSVARWEWDFGDGSTASGVTAAHTYAAAGTYQVALTVTDDDGLTDRTVRSVTVTGGSTTPGEESVVVQAGSRWSWRYAVEGPPAGWNGVAFDAAAWASGDAVLGFGSTVPLATDIDTFSATGQRPLAAYFRRTFQVADPSQVTRLVLESVADDGVVVYVNGTEVARSNMPSGPVSVGTYASSARNTTVARSSPVVVEVPVGLLRAGTNVVAAETHLNYRSTRDISFDLEATMTGGGGGEPLPEPPPEPDPEPQPGAESVVVATGSGWSWRYAVEGPPAGWNGVAFDAAAWASGDAVLGFGSTVPLATDIDTFSATGQRPLAAYFRRTFQVADPSQVTRLVLESVADDGVVVYVNGTEVARSNMPSGPVSVGTYASSARNTTVARSSPVVVEVPVGLLRAGTNVVAAETHLNYRSTRDISFDLEATMTGG